MCEREETVESPGAYVTAELLAAIYAWPCVHSECPPCSDGYHLGKVEGCHFMMWLG